MKNNFIFDKNCQVFGKEVTVTLPPRVWVKNNLVKFLHDNF